MGGAKGFFMKELLFVAVAELTDSCLLSPDRPNNLDPYLLNSYLLNSSNSHLLHFSFYFTRIAVLPDFRWQKSTKYWSRIVGKLPCG